MAGSVAVDLGPSDEPLLLRTISVYAQLLPAIAFLIVFFILPIGCVLVLSVTDPAFSFSHFERLFTTPLYLRVLLNTFLTSLVVTFACLVLGYPLAYVISRRSDWVARLLFAAVALSFWTGFLVRTYAWLIVLGNSGPLASALRAVGVRPVPQLLFTSFSSALGMTHILLPYMVLSLASVMRRVDSRYLLAAESLGARPFTAFRLVFLPLSLPGVVNGAVLVFTVCLGFYVTPILLGAPSNMMISQLINEQIESLLDFGFASALAAVLLVITMAILLIYNRLLGLDRLWG
jgi:putative spermidine/putrescine transport system permease protein